MQGHRTWMAAALISIAAVATALAGVNLAPLLGDMAAQKVAVVLAIVMVVLRAITSTPIGKGTPNE